MKTKLCKLQHGDFVSWRRPDMGSVGEHDTRAGTLARGRVAQCWHLPVKTRPIEEVLADMSEKDIEDVKDMKMLEGLRPILESVGIDIEQAWQEFAQSGRQIESPDGPPVSVYVFFELLPGVCECGCGGENYQHCGYSPLEYSLISGETARPNCYVN